MRHFDEARDIWLKHVPRSGQAATVQGELLRAVEKLRDQAQRNGNGNWDAGFEALLRFLGERLLDPAVFAPEVLDETRKILKRLGDRRNPVLEDGPYDTLADRVVEYFRHHGSLPHARNPKLKR